MGVRCDCDGVSVSLAWAKMQQTRISLVSLILLLWGIPLYFFEWNLLNFSFFLVRI